MFDVNYEEHTKGSVIHIHSQEYQGFVGSEDVVPSISGKPGCYE